MAVAVPVRWHRGGGLQERPVWAPTPLSRLVEVDELLNHEVLNRSATLARHDVRTFLRQRKGTDVQFTALYGVHLQGGAECKEVLSVVAQVHHQTHLIVLRGVAVLIELVVGEEQHVGVAGPAGPFLGTLS